MEVSPKPTKGLFSSHTFKVGTLTYTRGALLTVMFWMLWADLCLQIMEQLPSIIPLQLKWLGASDTLIGFIKDSFPAILTVAMVPVIGMQSDRHRGPMGRRKPFLLWCTIPVLGFLVMLGFSEPIARGLHGLIGGIHPVFTANGIGIALIMFFAAGFFFFNLYIMQVYQYMIADVIPKEAMGTFLGMFRAIGAAAGFIFFRWVFVHAETSVWGIYTGCGILYALAFFLLIWRVKEGEYPPVEESVERVGPIMFIKRYAKECFGNSFYLKMFSVAFFYWSAYVPFLTFVVFYATQSAGADYAPSLGVDVAEFGKIKGWTLLPKVIIFLALGPLIDRFHALRVLKIGAILVAITYLAGFYIVQTPNQFLWWWISNEVAHAIFQLAYLAMFPALLPREKYGQFFSANQLFFSVGLVAAPILCGALMDLVKDYRYLYLWSGICTIGATIFVFALFRHWKRLGGDESYVAPGSSE